MKVTILGTCGGVPIPKRAQSGVLVQTENTNVLMDCGMGVPLRLKEADHDPEDIDLILITHSHLDHVQDLPSLTKAHWLLTDENMDCPLVCPEEMTDWLPGLWKSTDEQERTDLKIRGEETTFEFKDLNISPFPTNHRPESQGYMIMNKDDSIIYTGDTAPTKHITETKTDLLIHELSLPMKTDLHTSPEELIKLMDNAGQNRPEHMILTHFYPQVIDELQETKNTIRTRFDIDVTAAKDLNSFEIN